MSLRSKIKYIFFISVLSISSGAALAQQENKWHTIRSTHFIFYYNNASDDFIDRILEKSEEYYEIITDKLGFRRYNFWLQENRARIYIYDDKSEFHSATGQPEWAMGAAIPQDKIIHTFPNQEGFFDTILPHEMSHIIFREFVGFDNRAVPFWLDEGVAIYHENLRRTAVINTVRKAIQDNSFIGLEALSNFNPLLIKDPELVRLFYAESFSIVDYLINEFGSEKFVFFCQELRDKRNLEKAIILSYPFADFQELDRKWQRSLKDE